MAKQEDLFKDFPKFDKPIEKIFFKPFHDPIWTENKAKLIERYLYYFILITRHGAYIDGFAGPQEKAKPEMWAAKLVLEIQPPRLTKFFLCESNPDSFLALEKLVESQLKKTLDKPKRIIKLYPQDFNLAVKEILERGLITEKEATFCLLDQRTFECKWETLKKLAEHKKQGYKIELFYFLAIKWFHRAFNAVQTESVIEEWWGNSSWNKLENMGVHEIKDWVCDRFKTELGYRFSHGWPIYEKKKGGAVMYYMIHATDHSEAPVLMGRAYRQAVREKETLEQLKMEFVEEGILEKHKLKMI